MEVRKSSTAKNCVELCRKIHTHPMEGHWKIARGGEGGLRSQNFRSKLKYEAKRKFNQGDRAGGYKTLNLSWGHSYSLIKKYYTELSTEHHSQQGR